MTSVLDAAQAVSDYQRWLTLKAADLAPPTLHRGTAIDREDLVQIGRIAIWRAAGTYDAGRGSAPAYLTMRAHGSMLDALRARQKHALYDLVYEPVTDDRPAPVDLEDLLIAAYHAGEIALALAELTPQQRKYVYLRFWGERTTQELTDEFGYGPSGVWAGAKKKLARRLMHLREAD